MMDKSERIYIAPPKKGFRSDSLLDPDPHPKRSIFLAISILAAVILAAWMAHR